MYANISFLFYLFLICKNRRPLRHRALFTVFKTVGLQPNVYANQLYIIQNIRQQVATGDDIRFPTVCNNLVLKTRLLSHLRVGDGSFCNRIISDQYCWSDQTAMP